jgi:hypothetical protein
VGLVTANSKLVEQNAVTSPVDERENKSLGCNGFMIGRPKMSE